MKAKIISIPLFAVIVFSLLFAVFAYGDDTSRYEGTLITSCSAFGYGDCDIVVGGLIYKLDLVEGETATDELLAFPSSFTEEINSYPRENILCDNPEMMGVAKYDEETEKWVLLDSERRQPPTDLDSFGNPTGAYKVQAWINEPGIYAVVQITSERVSDEEREAGRYCLRRMCGVYRGFETDPDSGNVKQNEDINLGFCNIIMGCDATADRGTAGAMACLEGTNPKNPSVCEATEEGGDCCEPYGDDGAPDGICDKDCWTLHDEGGVAIDSTDPDCVAAVELYEEPNNENMMALSHKFVPEIAEDRDIEWNIKEEEGYPVLMEGNSFVQAFGAALPSSIFLYDLQDRRHDIKTERLNLPLPPIAVKKIVLQTRKVGSSENHFVNVSLRVHMDKSTGKPKNADKDNDNFSNYGDCHDTNPFIYPGAQEIENSLDDDCDSYGQYDVRSAEKFAGDVRFSASGTGCGAGEACGASALMTAMYQMPCKGYIQFTGIDDVSYAEVWTQQGCTEAECGETVCDPVVLRDQYDARVKFCVPDNTNIAGTWQPWHAFRPIFAYGGDSGEDETLDFECGGQCVPGSIASCRISRFGVGSCDGTASYIGPALRLNAWNREGHMIISEERECCDCSAGCYYGCDECTVPEGSLNKINDILNRAELQRGDILYTAVTGEPRCTSDCDYGDIKFDVYCYKPIPPAEVPDSVDEGFITAGERRPLVVHVCSTDDFNPFTKTCVDGELCNFTTPTESGGCDYTADTELGPKKLYAFACRSEEEECFRFYKGDFRVCTPDGKERCAGVIANPDELNIDMDCDGLNPFVTNEDGTVDITRPEDPDCIEAVEAGALHGVCKPETKEWYDSSANGGEGGFVSEGYCQQCGGRDSVCAKTCGEDELSCGDGCRENACDISANKWCKSGAWTESGYPENCGLLDFDFYSAAGRDCKGNACDLVAEKTCYRSSWVSERAGVPYCNSPACKLVDFDCEAACTPGACDVDKNAYCNSDSAWSAEDAADYCSKCGALDADCGTQACTETLATGDRNCDKIAKKYCQAGEWLEDNYCEKCGAVDDSCSPVCPDVWELTETGCSDGIDNNCDGDLDCLDDGCASSDECEGACIPGRTESCGSDEGVCTTGTHTCGMDGRWSECEYPEDAALPEPEVCNGWDDDCDGAADEGCVCTNGEIRACGRDRGVCSSSTQKCDDGTWSICYPGTGAVVPSEEACGDGRDNDCDGEIDEGCPCTNGATQECGVTEGICVKGIQTCAGGEWGVCAGEKGKLTENTNTAGTCSDSIDNDCDGKKDLEDDGCTITRTEDIAPSCTDHIKNQDEEEIDCGGVCPPCVAPANCHNRVMDPGEDGMDCGGECSVQCTEKTRVRSGTLTTTEEQTEIAAECGDFICDAGEEDSCPGDCESVASGISLTSYLLPVILILGIIGLGYFAYKKGLIKLKGKKPEKTSSSFPTPKESAKAPAKQAARQYAAPSKPGKQFKTKEELALENSLKQEKELIGK